MNRLQQASMAPSKGGVPKGPGNPLATFRDTGGDTTSIRHTSTRSGYEVASDSSSSSAMAGEGSMAFKETWRAPSVKERSSGTAQIARKTAAVGIARGYFVSSDLETSNENAAWSTQAVVPAPPFASAFKSFAPPPLQLERIEIPTKLTVPLPYTSSSENSDQNPLVSQSLDHNPYIKAGVWPPLVELGTPFNHGNTAMRQTSTGSSTFTDPLSTTLSPTTSLNTSSTIAGASFLAELPTETTSSSYTDRIAEGETSCDLASWAQQAELRYNLQLALALRLVSTAEIAEEPYIYTSSIKENWLSTSSAHCSPAATSLRFWVRPL